MSYFSGKVKSDIENEDGKSKRIQQEKELKEKFKFTNNEDEDDDNPQEIPQYIQTSNTTKPNTNPAKNVQNTQDDDLNFNDEELYGDISEADNEDDEDINYDNDFMDLNDDNEFNRKETIINNKNLNNNNIYYNDNNNNQAKTNILLEFEVPSKKITDKSIGIDTSNINNNNNKSSLNPTGNLVLSPAKKISDKRDSPLKTLKKESEKSVRKSPSKSPTKKESDISAIKAQSPAKKESERMLNQSPSKSPSKKESERMLGQSPGKSPTKKESEKIQGHNNQLSVNNNQNISPNRSQDKSKEISQTEVVREKTTKDLFNELEKSLNKSLHSYRQNNLVSNKNNDVSLSKHSSNNNFKVHDISDSNLDKVDRRGNKGDYKNDSFNSRDNKAQIGQNPFYKKENNTEMSNNNENEGNENENDYENDNDDIKMDTNPIENDYLPKLRLKPKEIQQPTSGLVKSKTPRKEQSEKTLSRRKSEAESFEKVFETYDKSKENDEYKKLLIEGNKHKPTINNYEKFSERKFEKHNMQNLVYNLSKEYAHIKVVNDGTFMQRMTFDNYKRQTKEKRLKKMIEKNKPKMVESKRIHSFNRLIEDANRRLEAKEKLEAMKEKILGHNNNVEKKFTKEEWKEIYAKRFQEYAEKREKKIEEAKYLKRRDQEEEERKLASEQVHKKVNPKSAYNVFNRNYDEAIKRKIKQEQNEQFNKNLERYYDDKKNIDQIPTLQKIQSYEFEKSNRLSKYDKNQIPEPMQNNMNNMNDNDEPSSNEPKPFGSNDYNSQNQPGQQGQDRQDYKPQEPSKKESSILDYGDSHGGAETSMKRADKSQALVNKSNKEKSSIIDFDYIDKSHDKKPSANISKSNNNNKSKNKLGVSDVSGDEGEDGGDDDEIIDFENFFDEEHKDNKEGGLNRSNLNKSNRSKDNNNILNKQENFNKSNMKSQRRIEVPIPEEDPNEKFFMNPEGQINPIVLENVKIYSGKQNEIMQKRSQFNDPKKLMSLKKNYIDNKPIISKPKPYSPPARKIPYSNYKKNPKMMTLDSFLINEEEDEIQTFVPIATEPTQDVPINTMSSGNNNQNIQSLEVKKTYIRTHDILKHSKTKPKNIHILGTKNFMPDFIAERFVDNIMKLGTNR